MFAIARVVPVAIALLASLAGGARLPAQESDVDAIKRVVRSETDAYFRRDSAAWKTYHIRDSTAVAMGIGSGGARVSLGWDAWGPAVIAEMKKNPQPIQFTFDDLDHRVFVDGGLAFAEYDQRGAFAPDTVFRVSRQHRVLLKRDGEWKIVSTGSFHLGTYDASPPSIEWRLRGVATTLNGAKKTRDALEVLKLNAQLFPTSGRVFQDLGEAYATAGEIKLAIRNYEKALAIDPKNEAGKVALAKLRASKSSP